MFAAVDVMVKQEVRNDIHVSPHDEQLRSSVHAVYVAEESKGLITTEDTES